MAKLTISLSQESLNKNAQILQRLASSLENSVNGTNEKLMLLAYLKLQQIFNERNLGNHVGEIKYELLDNGFHIWVDDWVVFFNEYGTGVYNANTMAKKIPWTYYKEGKFYTTVGQKPKFMFEDLKKEILSIAGPAYSSAVSNAISQQSYESFRKSLGQ